ncbi:hypothetical protein R6Q59_014989 [Mikania micrantha]
MCVCVSVCLNMESGQHFHRYISTPDNNASSLIQTTPPISMSTSRSLNFLSFDFPLHQTLFQSNHQAPPPPAAAAAELVPNDDDDNDEHHQYSCSNHHDELFRIKSASESYWFKDFTNWDHVSRKLAEMGDKKSSEKSKDKFEEEACKSFSGHNKSMHLISEEHLSNSFEKNIDHHDHIGSIANHQEQPEAEEKREEENLDIFEKDQVINEVMAKSKKRKRKHKMIKALCFELVNKMMSQQEEMHKKLLQDMAKRDEEKMEREEAWWKEEMERVDIEIGISEHEQAMARDRQSTITQYLNKLTSFSNKPLETTRNVASSSDNIEKQQQKKKISKDDDDDDDVMSGKRWPRDEVLALIDIRSNVDHVGGGGGGIWERISNGMLELGYKRSAKRCKEKWENINKYFRKTNKKERSLESTTCPYYHHLTKLYKQTKPNQPIHKIKQQQ